MNKFSTTGHREAILLTLLILDFCSLEVGDHQLLALKPASLWFCVTVALANQSNPPSASSSSTFHLAILVISCPDFHMLGANFKTHTEKSSQSGNTQARKCPRPFSLCEDGLCPLGLCSKQKGLKYHDPLHPYSFLLYIIHL